jgi:multiple sugar transport system substrate-binding protein
MAAGTGGPDVYLITGPNYKKWAHDGLGADVTGYVTRDKAAAADLRSMLKATLDFYTTGNGKMQGVPWDLSTISVAYNLEEIERRGLKPPAEPGAQWDWTAFLDYAKRLTPGDGSRYGVNADPGIERGWYNWVVANGGRIFSDDFSRCTINTPEAVDALDAYMGVANKLHAAPPLDWLSQQSQGQPHAAYQLINGLVNMQTEGDWFFGWYGKVPGFRWDVAPMPVSPKTKKTASVANMRGVVLSPIAQNRDLAWAWIARMMSRQVQDRIPALMGEVPARNDSIDQVYLNPEKSPTPKSRRLLKAAIDATVPLPGHPLLPWNGDGGVNTTANVNDVYEGRKEAKAALADVQDKMNALIGAAKK